MKKNKKTNSKWIKKRNRIKSSLKIGSLPRLVVYRSNRNIFAQIIDDLKNSKLSYQSLKIGKILESDNKQFVKQRIDKMIQDLDFCITNLSS